jgi:hypothetical protein
LVISIGEALRVEPIERGSPHKELTDSLGRRDDRYAWITTTRATSRSSTPRRARRFPNHKTIELADAGHFFFEDAAPQMVSEIIAFASGEYKRSRRPYPKDSWLRKDPYG